MSRWDRVDGAFIEPGDHHQRVIRNARGPSMFIAENEPDDVLRFAYQFDIAERCFEEPVQPFTAFVGAGKIQFVKN